MRSGLVHLLDRLCSLTNHRSDGANMTEAHTTRQRVSAMAWAGFQVLSSRCVTWEQEEGKMHVCVGVGWGGVGVAVERESKKVPVCI